MSPQHISAIERMEARLAPLRTRDGSASFFFCAGVSVLTPVAPAPSVVPDSESPSIIAASMSSSLG